MPHEKNPCFFRLRGRGNKIWPYVSQDWAFFEVVPCEQSVESFFKHAHLIAYLFVVVIRREVDVGADSGMEVGRRKWT